jgi:hypothetical protein
MWSSEGKFSQLREEKFVSKTAEAEKYVKSCVDFPTSNQLA